MAERTDVAMQAYLDSLSQVPGSILFRARREWRALPPGPPGSALAWTEENGIHWSTAFSGGGGPGTTYINSLSWSTVNATDRRDDATGNLYEIGPDNIVVHGFELYPNEDGFPYSVDIYRESDAVRITRAALWPTADQWNRVLIEPVTLVAGEQYVIQSHEIAGGRVRQYINANDFETPTELTLIEGRLAFGKNFAEVPTDDIYAHTRILFTIE